MLAVRQRGHVTRMQLLELGFAEGTISNRVKIGRLHRTYPGVYAVGHPRTGPVDRAAAAVLACGPGALLAHFSGAALWGWVRRWREPFEVIVPGDRRPKQIRVHRSHQLNWRDRTRQHGIPVTSPARTILDCAPRLSDDRLARLVDDALRGHLSRDALADVLARNPRHAGTRRLLPFAFEAGAPTRSQFERAFKAFARRFGLPPYELNVFVGGREVDVLFRAERVIVELDGYEFHRGRGSFERDRNHDVEALLDGFVTVRITWERMNGTPAREAERLHTILRRRRHELGL
jgi:very-short-patch-repair endonuclease